ncbi:MAG: VWA domain-containing protein [Candidatus Hodarchaeales archaeon]
MPVILNFISLLRYFGLPISPAETIQAQQAYQIMGVEDHEILRYSLKACLVKRHQDIKIFNDSFDIFFLRVYNTQEYKSEDINKFNQSVSRFLQRLAGESIVYNEIGQLLLENRIDEATQITSSKDVQSDGSGNLSGMGFSESQQKSLIKSLQRSFRMAFNIPVPIHGLTAEQREKIPKSTLELAVNLFLFENNLNKETKITAEIMPDPMSKMEQFLDYDLNYISISLSNVKNQLLEIGRILASRERRKRKRFAKGKMDFRRTFRKNLSHGGAPISLVFKRKKKQDPDIVILNDVSGSTQWASSWFFVICYAARSVFRKIRIYEFDNTTVDVTSALELKTIDRALAERQKCWENTLRPRRIHSDYQTSLEDFLQLVKYKPLIKKTSVLMLGDCRDNEGNWRQTGPISAELVKKIVSKVKRLIILNPESKSLWDTGDSIVSHYQNAGAEVFHVSNFRELIRLVFELK